MKYYNLKMLRCRAEIEQSKLANMIGISLSSYSLKETGKSQFKLNECKEIAKILNEKLNEKHTIDFIFKN